MTSATRRWGLTGVVILLIAAVAAVGFWMSRGGDSGAGDAAATPSQPLSAIPGESTGGTGTTVLEPGPQQTVAADPEPVTAGGSVSVVVTYAGWDAEADVLEVDGYVSGVVEDGGTCRLTATRQGESVTAEGPGVADASTTSCGALLLQEEDGLSAGTWDVVLSYESDTSEGSSAAGSVRVEA